MLLRFDCLIEADGGAGACLRNGRALEALVHGRRPGGHKGSDVARLGVQQQRCLILENSKVVSFEKACKLIVMSPKTSSSKPVATTKTSGYKTILATLV